ncbi:MAG: CPBP family intramembrane metalloprotease [Actinomycetota bacterium]|nr:CPBP family intramembrane metalloprotease [Actinomycetota bacterium]
MRVGAAALATALAAALIFVQPWAGRRRYRRLLAARETDPRARMRHYRRGILGEWAATGLVVLIGFLAHRGPGSIGLGRIPHFGSAAVTVGLAAGVLTLSAVVFRLGGDGIRQALRRQSEGFRALLPHTAAERAVFALLAVTAGVCEELLYRGFGLAYLRWLWPGATRPWLIALTAAAFGVAHLYQGVRGVVLTGLVGGYLAWLVLSSGSLVPAMVIHALLDLRILALPDLDQPATVDARRRD